MIEALYSGIMELEKRLSKASLNVGRLHNHLWMRLAPAFSARNLVVTFDSNTNVIRYIAYYHIRNLRRIRRCMYFAVVKAIATALVSSIYDYCNSLHHYSVINDVLTFQRVHNTLTRVVTWSPLFSD